MALNVQKGVISSPTAVGIVSYPLPANFDPKAIIFWVTYQTADGVVKANGSFCMGAATASGGTVQQFYRALWSQDNVAASQFVAGYGNTLVLKGYNGVATTNVDYTASCDSITTGVASAFALNWTDIPTTAGILVHYLALGGPNIDGYIGNFLTGTTATTVNATVPAGWGQPNLVLLWGAYTANADAAVSETQMFAVAKSDTERWVSASYYTDAAASVTVTSFERAAALTVGTTLTGLGDLSPRASWPADGFQVNITTAFAGNFYIYYLALKGNFNSTILTGTAPTAAAPQTQTFSLASGTTCRGALLWGNSIPFNAALDQTHADLIGRWVGATDGTNQGVCGHLEDDANATSACSNFFSRTKTVQHYVESGITVGTLQSEASATLSGSDAVLTWNDTDTVARQFAVLLLGDTSAAPPPPSVQAFPAAILAHL
jgi:hypothetical protein